MNLFARRFHDGRSRIAAALLVAAVGCVLVLVLTGGTRLAGAIGTSANGATAGAPPPVPRAGDSFTLMQMNLCLSGLAGCFRNAYPAVVGEAVTRIREAHPDAVTFNEACRGDVARIARSTGYHLRFQTVVYLGAPLLCVHPDGRGLFGDAVLTRAPIDASENHPFADQSDIEQRRWLCLTTRRGQDVCTAHLSTRHPGPDATTNDAQCAELSTILAGRAGDRTVVFGGDVNRAGTCAPAGFWTRTDGSAGQDPGVQHVYGNRAGIRSPAVTVLPARHSDHDVLLVSALLAPHAPPGCGPEC